MSKQEFVQVETLYQLKTGDLIRAKNGGRGYVVTANYGDRVTAVMTADVTNAAEWEVLRPAGSAGAST